MSDKVNAIHTPALMRNLCFPLRGFDACYSFAAFGWGIVFKSVYNEEDTNGDVRSGCRC